MSENMTFNFTMLLEHEVRAAGKALRALEDGIARDTKDDPDAKLSRETQALLWQAIEASTAALWDAAEDRPIIFTQAEALGRARAARRRRAEDGAR